MRIFDKKTLTLKGLEKEYKIEVTLKEVLVRNNHKTTKAFCKIIN